MGFFFALLLVWLPCAFYASHVAADKGHNGAAWFFGGFLFGPIALIAAAGLSDQTLRRYIRLTAENQGVDLSKAKPAVDAALDKAWNEETQSWEPIDLYPKLK